MKVLKMKFGMSGEKVDAMGIRFYGKIDRELEHLGSISEMLSDPDVSPMIKNKRVTLWFTLEQIRPYNQVLNLLGELIAMLKREKCTIINSSIDGLVDAPEYTKKLEGKFAVNGILRGYNAAGGFSVTAEKNDSNLKFSLEEVEKIKNLSTEFGQIVYCCSLKRLI